MSVVCVVSVLCVCVTCVVVGGVGGIDTHTHTRDTTKDTTKDTTWKVVLAVRLYGCTHLYTHFRPSLCVCHKGEGASSSTCRVVVYLI